MNRARHCRIYRAPQSLPAAHLSVAVLCNTTNANATQYANRVSDIFLGDRIKKRPAPERRPQTPPDVTPPTALELESLIFVRDVSGKVEGFSIKQDRVWDLRFVREK